MRVNGDISLFVSRKAARRGAVALAVLIGLWIVTFASHIHAGDEHAAPQSAHHCSLCLSLPSAAPAPAILQLAASPASHSSPVTAATREGSFEIPAFYQSRAPPLPQA